MQMEISTAPFWNKLNYDLTSNIPEVMKFFTLGDKVFEWDFGFADCCDSKPGCKPEVAVIREFYLLFELLPYKVKIRKHEKSTRAQFCRTLIFSISLL